MENILKIIHLTRNLKKQPNSIEFTGFGDKHPQQIASDSI